MGQLSTAAVDAENDARKEVKTEAQLRMTVENIQLCSSPEQ